MSKTLVLYSKTIKGIRKTLIVGPNHQLIFTKEYMKLKPIEEVASQDEARQIAVDWQIWQAEQSLSYGELAEYQTYFEELAERFFLEEEFKENAII